MDAGGRDDGRAASVSCLNLIWIMCMQISNSFDLDDARRSYFSSLFPLNPGGIVPTGPTLADLNLSRDAGRGQQDAESLFHMRKQPAVMAAV